MEDKKFDFKDCLRNIWNFCTTGFMPVAIIAFVAGTIIVIATLA